MLNVYIFLACKTNVTLNVSQQTNINKNTFTPPLSEDWRGEDHNRFLKKPIKSIIQLK